MRKTKFVIRTESIGHVLSLLHRFIGVTLSFLLIDPDVTIENSKLIDITTKQGKGRIYQLNIRTESNDEKTLYWYEKTADYCTTGGPVVAMLIIESPSKELQEAILSSVHYTL